MTMGCDIHEHVEILVDGKWQSLYQPVIDFDERFTDEAQHERIRNAVLNNTLMNRDDHEVFRDYSYINFERDDPEIAIEFVRDYELFSALNDVRSRGIVNVDSQIATNGLPNDISFMLKRASRSDDLHSHGHVYFNTLFELNWDHVFSWGQGIISFEDAYVWLTKNPDEKPISYKHYFDRNPFNDFVCNLSTHIKYYLITKGVDWLIKSVNQDKKQTFNNYYFCDFIVPVTYKEAACQIYDNLEMYHRIVDRYCAGDATKARLVFWYDN
jgi:hypothetical protein